MSTAREDRAVTAKDLSLAEYVCLAIIAEGPSHGWAIAKELEVDGPVGRIWTLTRPNTYRTTDLLVAKGLASRSAAEHGSGAARVPLHITPRGRRVARLWLNAPIDHVRHVRSELLLKLAFLERAGLDTAEFCSRQRDHLGPTIAAIREAGTSTKDPVELWRREQATAAQRFLDLLANETGPVEKKPAQRNHRIPK